MNDSQIDLIAASSDLMDIILEYSDCTPLKNSHGNVPLVTTLFNTIKSQKLARLKEFLTATLSGNYDKVETMLKNEKDLSFLTDRLEKNDCVTAPSGQSCNHETAFRTALAIEDTPMIKLIRNKLIEVAGEEEVNKQYFEKIPDGWEADEIEKWSPLFTMLNTLEDTIRDAKNDISSSDYPKYTLTIKKESKVYEILTQFRLHIEALLHEVITTGRHCNPYLLLKAYQTYEEIFRYFGNEQTDPRALLYWQQVIGTIQRLLPINYIQAHLEGLSGAKRRLYCNNTQERSLVIQYFDKGWVSKDLYPNIASGLGFEFAIFGESPRVAVIETRRGGAHPSYSAVDASTFESFIYTKQRIYSNFCPKNITLQNSSRAT